ncbi:hypothetical protein [Novacetimonas pomaceti]|uniref:hypothetical protein n=1 Tax=Novacetimonas pomaceti TaxID=2021998 RepID=UPI001EEFBBAE|nr:hypothetical protein [Novacetimonas pomaceti]
MRGKFFRHGVMALTMSGLCLLAGCLDVPHPFQRRGLSQLSNAPPARLAVPQPTQALLVSMAAQTWQKDMVAAMLDQSVPAVGQPVKSGDWWLRMTATLQGNQVIPTYAVITPKGEVRGETTGAPVPAASWSAGSEAVMQASAMQAAPEVAALLTGIQAAQMQSDPHSLKNRPAHVYFQGVKGAPGDGNAMLSRAFVASLRDAHDQIQHSQSGADFTVGCTVVVTQLPVSGPARQRLTLTWRVVDSHGKEAGAATQIHDIAAHTLDGKWGDAAEAAGEEAAGGVRQIISRYSGRDNVPLPATTAAAPTQASKPAGAKSAAPVSATPATPASDVSVSRPGRNAPLAQASDAVSPAPVSSTPTVPVTAAPASVATNPVPTSAASVPSSSPSSMISAPAKAPVSASPAPAAVESAPLGAASAAATPSVAHAPSMMPSSPAPMQAPVASAAAASSATSVAAPRVSAPPRDIVPQQPVSEDTPATTPVRRKLPGVTLPPRRS